MWTGPQKCWTVGMRTSTHVSYKLTAARVNAGRVKIATGMLVRARMNPRIVPLIRAAGVDGKVGRTWEVC